MTTKLLSRSDLTLFRNLVSRQVRQDYLQNLSGMAWLVIQPLMLLAIYSFVFGTIFRARIPDAGDIGFMPWLAVAFWPWIAFSEAVLRGSNAITSNAELVGKVAFRKELLPLSAVTAVFGMHAIGYAAVLVVLQILGTPVHWAMIPVAAVVLLLLYVAAAGLTLITSTLQVFVRDLAQFLPPLMTFWFFATPILYGRSLLPDELTWLADMNPMTWFVTTLREALLFGQLQTGITWFWALLGVGLVSFVGLRFFRRFDGHFEDFL